MKLVKVQGHTGLARDLNSGAIVNINTSEAHAARSRKIKRKAIFNQHEQLQQDVEYLKQDMNEIKSLLNKLVEKL